MIVHSLKLVDYLHVQADNPWYHFYLDNSELLNYPLHFFYELIQIDSSYSVCFIEDNGFYNKIRVINKNRGEIIKNAVAHKK